MATTTSNSKLSTLAVSTWAALRQSRWRWLGVPILLGLLLTQMVVSSTRTSAAFDETITLVAGYSYLHTGDPRLSWEHPPLAHILAGLSIVGRDDMAPFPTDDPIWQAGNTYGFVDRYLWEDNFAIAPDLIRAGRWPLMLLTVGFGLTLFAAFYQLLGEGPAWAGLIVYSFDPNVLANGRLIITDLAVAGFLLIAVWRLARYLEAPRPVNLIVTGLAAGLAVGSKISAVMIAPIFLLIALTYPSRIPGVAKRLLALLGMAGVAFIVLWALYGFEIGPVNEVGLPVPMPTFWRGVPQVWARIEQGTPTYLLGQISENGWWYYFPVVFLLKSPLPLLIMMGIGHTGIWRDWRRAAVWWVPFGIFLITAIISPLQIGYRHILPLLFFGIGLAALAWQELPRRQWLTFGMGGLLVWTVIEGVIAFPGYLGYANELAGGPRNSWRHFADMNVDWGQDLVALKAFSDDHPDEPIRLAYFGSADPAAYGLDVIDLPGFFNHVVGPEVSAWNPYTPPEGLYAISATSLHLGMVYTGQDIYAAFSAREPDDLVGRSLLIYAIDYPANMPVERAVVSGQDVWQISREAYGLENGERLIAKWSGDGGFIAAGNGPARYIVGGALEGSAISEALAAQTDPVEASTYFDLIPESSPAVTPDGESVTLPVPAANGLSLLSWQVVDDSSTNGVMAFDSYWQVNEPIGGPLAIFVHLTGADSIPLSQWDGWPFAFDGLESGDILIIRHTLALPDSGTYQIQIGLYEPPTGPRILFDDADRLILTQLDR